MLGLGSDHCRSSGTGQCVINVVRDTDGDGVVTLDPRVDEAEDGSGKVVVQGEKRGLPL